ncbi:MAG: hypothetical protein RIT43_420 [Bacteroidota bacterium]
MKNLIKIIATLTVCISLHAQTETPWIQRAENASFLAKIDSVFELRFKKQMDTFPVFDNGALNFAHCESHIGECSEEYVYNQAYYHEMMTFSSPIEEYTVESLLKAIETAGDDPVFADLMYLLDPDKYWLGYYPMEGKYYLVICLGVDREKIYAEMGLKFGK